MTGSGGSVNDTAHPLSSFNDQWIYWTIQLDLLSGKSSIYRMETLSTPNQVFHSLLVHPWKLFGLVRNEQCFPMGRHD